jgi:hypothetical protein
MIDARDGKAKMIWYASVAACIISRMPNGPCCAMLVLLLAPRVEPSGCPITLISGTGVQNSISVTFRSTDKWPVRRLEFNCSLVGARTNKAERAHCAEPNASFLPGAEYTVSYAIPGSVRAPVLVSVKSVTFADGRTWKPTKRDPCRTLKIKRVK